MKTQALWDHGLQPLEAKWLARILFLSRFNFEGKKNSLALPLIRTRAIRKDLQILLHQ